MMRHNEQNLLVRGSRLAGSYLPTGGAHDHELTLAGGLVDMPASRFLPVTKNGVLERLRLQRITSAMDVAARRQRPKRNQAWSRHPPSQHHEQCTFRSNCAKPG